MRLRPRPDLRPETIEGIVTVAPEMKDFLHFMRRAARSGAPVLIRGETGTGKELVSRAIHALSPRRAGPFQALNCATLTAEMLASELFGHVKGAFTGAISDRPGLLRQANHGTLFLDEIAEMPLDIQARLLRVLQEQQFIPLGGTDRVSVDIRFVSATHVALRDAVEQRRFREDLMYRVRVVPLYLPSLVERTGDVEALTWHFIDAYNARGGRRIDGVSEDAMQLMLAYHWPGNIRELLNVLEYAYAIGEGPILVPGCLTPELRGEGPPGRHHGHERGGVVLDERDQILEALERARGRRGEAADLLGMSRSTLWRKMREHHIKAY